MLLNAVLSSIGDYYALYQIGRENRDKVKELHGKKVYAIIIPEEQSIKQYKPTSTTIKHIKTKTIHEGSKPGCMNYVQEKSLPVP
ncbi:hypothetical protein DKAM_1031 [Desulfurococcus amylolyticus 1221n]|uniref:Uncharacterized protein n=1 Tax=Desulfurococcus amylolyticus (strain DSM 18924 / JCM 16383 / VKM B-2413 / 1221n) TaxID=490899 RepID=B8D5H6_DESA1|nr:hypothetical protein [Desulfurococcus amylolyticus]ACL11357.1 hypothetical protein DKAM_1031 [Desulfurococcus amylolyticus 1221n]